MAIFSHCLTICSLTVLLVGRCTLPSIPNEGGDTVSIPSNLEIPAYDTEEHIIEYNGFTVSYNHTTLVPNWVAYELTDEEVVGQISRADKFVPDPDIKGRCSTTDDYKGSGYDRGHMAPAGDMKWDAKAMEESFYTTNICPQNHNLNSGDWKELEEQVVCYADKFYSKTKPGEERSVMEAMRALEKFGWDGIRRFQKWVDMFE